MENLNVTFENLDEQNDSLRVNISGQFNDMNAYDFKADLLKIIEERNSNCILDITSVSKMDIVGVNAILMTHRALQRQGKELVVISKSTSPVDKIIGLTSVDKIINLKRA